MRKTQRQMTLEKGNHELLSRAAHWVEECLEQDEAVVVVGGWLLLEEASRLIEAWENTIVTTRFTDRMEAWGECPDAALFCTPLGILEQGNGLGDLGRPLNVVLLASSRRAAIEASLKDKCDAFAILDVQEGTHTIYDASVAASPATFKLRPGKISKQWAWLF